MNRRSFLALLGAVLGGVALEQAIPLGRVWSFPSKLALPLDVFDELYVAPAAKQLTTEWITEETLRLLKRNLTMYQLGVKDFYDIPVNLGDQITLPTLRIARPRPYLADPKE